MTGTTFEGTREYCLQNEQGGPENTGDGTKEGNQHVSIHPSHITAFILPFSALKLGRVQVNECIRACYLLSPDPSEHRKSAEI